jgi:hypothetical protein
MNELENSPPELEGNSFLSDSEAIYAKQTLIKQSKRLNDEFGKGYSVDNLENMGKFYSVYGKSETLSRISGKRPTRGMPPEKAKRKDFEKKDL